MLNQAKINSLIGDGQRYDNKIKALEEYFNALKPGEAGRVVLLNGGHNKYRFCAICKFKDGQCFYWLYGNNQKECDAKLEALRIYLHRNE